MRGVLGAGIGRHAHVELGAAGADLVIEALAGDQRAVSYLLPGRAAERDRAVARHELVGRGVEMRRGETEQHEPTRRRCLADLRAGIADRAAAVARALIHRLRRRSHDDIEPIERKIELLGRDLRECGRNPGAGLDLAGIEGRGVVGVHRKPRIELIRRRRGEVAARGSGRQPRSRGRRIRGGRPEESEGDDEPARGPQEPAPAEPGSAACSADRLMHIHDRPSVLCALAGGALDGAHNPHMRAAAAQIGIEGVQ